MGMGGDARRGVGADGHRHRRVPRRGQERHRAAREAFGADLSGGAPLATRWDALAETIATYRDVLDARAIDGSVPDALAARGWDTCLLALSDDALDALEIGGCEAPWPGGTPPALERLRATAAAMTDVPALERPSMPELGPRRLRRLETERKRAQIDHLAGLVLPLAQDATRIVDVGAGHGHLARDIAARTPIRVVGLERDAALTDRARRLPRSGGLSFELADVLTAGLSLGATDCVLGLHACGELGDVLVRSVASQARSALLVGCCLQKRRQASRAPLMASRARSADVDLPKHLLGLSNYTAREEGVEASRRENLAAKERRMALHRLLSDAGLVLHFGAEMDGLNRRAAHGDLGAMIARAFPARGLALPSAASIADAVRWAATQHGRVRRLALPRALLARVLEVFVLVDRALYLETHGFDVRVGTAFESAISARNLTLVARRKDA